MDAVIVVYAGSLDLTLAAHTDLEAALRYTKRFSYEMKAVKVAVGREFIHNIRPVRLIVSFEFCARSWKIIFDA